MRTRDLAQEIIDDVPQERLAVAALYLSGSGKTYGTGAEIENFIRSLTVRQLKMLREVAMSLIDRGEVGTA